MTLDAVVAPGQIWADNDPRTVVHDRIRVVRVLKDPALSTPPRPLCQVGTCREDGTDMVWTERTTRIAVGRFYSGARARSTGFRPFRAAPDR